MPPKCEHSSLAIPNDAGYAPLAGRLAGGIAGRYGSGREGKEVILVKHLKSKMVEDYFDACLLQPFESPPPPLEHPTPQRLCRVRPLEPEDASEVSKIIYKTCGYNYPNDYFYYPRS